MRQLLSLALILAPTVTLVGCGAYFRPLSVESALVVNRSGSLDGYAQRAVSEARSSETGRYLLDSTVRVEDLQLGHVAMTVTLSSLYQDRVDTRGYYVWLHSGDTVTRVSAARVSDLRDDPQDFTFPCKKKQKSTVRMSDGTSVEVETDVDAICEGTEHYYTRTNEIAFDAASVLDPDAEQLWLELRDLTGRVYHRWSF